MTAITNLPDLRPSLLLDFANSGRVDPRITFSRVSTATYFDNKGVLRTAPAGVPRIDYDPATGECRGLLVEEQRTNFLRYSEEFDNAYWIKARSSITTNAVTAPDGTLSAAAWRTEQKGRWLGRVFRPLIDLVFALFEKDHCRKSFESERNGRHLPKEYVEDGWL